MTLQEEYGTPIMLGINRIWYSVLRNAVDHIGGLGNIEGVQVQWSENPTHLKKRGFTNDQIYSRNFTNSIHGLSILNYLCGELVNISVNGTNNNKEFGWNMALQGISITNKIGQFISSWSSVLPWRFAFHGNNKIYEFEKLETCTYTNLKTREKTILLGEDFDQKFKPGFYLQAKSFYSVLNGMAIPDEATLCQAKILFRYANALTNLFLHEDSCAG